MWISLLQVKGLDVDTLYVSHIQVNQAQKQRRRTYRAHGRINRKFIWSLFCLLCFATAWMFCMLQLNMFNHLLQLTCPLRATSSWSCLRRKSQWRKRFVVLYTVCAHLSNTSDNVVLIWLICLFFRRSLRLQPGRLKEGSSTVLEWVRVDCRLSLPKWKFWLVICRLLYQCTASSLSPWSVSTAYTIRSYEWSVCGFFPYLYWWWCQCSLNVLVVAGGWCWFSLREQYCRLVGD